MASEPNKTGDQQLKQDLREFYELIGAQRLDDQQAEVLDAAFDRAMEAGQLSLAGTFLALREIERDSTDAGAKSAAESLLARVEQVIPKFDEVSAYLMAGAVDRKSRVFRLFDESQLMSRHRGTSHHPLRLNTRRLAAQADLLGRVAPQEQLDALSDAASSAAASLPSPAATSDLVEPSRRVEFFVHLVEERRGQSLTNDEVRALNAAGDRIPATDEKPSGYRLANELRLNRMHGEPEAVSAAGARIAPALEAAWAAATSEPRSPYGPRVEPGTLGAPF